MKKLKNKKQIFLYALSGMGINMLNLIVGSYLTDALMTKGFDMNIENWTYMNRTLVITAVWGVLVTISKILDGFIDIPLAGLTDNLKSKWGKRRLPIFIGMLGVIISYCLYLIPLSSSENSLLNTIWFGVILCLFYTTYTLTMVTYYATFSEIIASESDRVFLSNCKSVFDVVYFILGHALIPAMIGGLNIRVIAWAFLPISLTMLIPLFMIKEKSTLPADVAKEAEKESPDASAVQADETVGIVQSIKYTIKNKKFLIWMALYAALQFGLQMFLTGMNVYFSGPLRFQGIYQTIIMACAFAPVMVTIVIYNKIVNKFGLKTGMRFTIGMFLIGIALMFVAWLAINPDATILKLIVACAGSVFASFGIGSFFSISYTIPSHLAEEERITKGVSHPAMYFAVQGVFSGVASAIATGVVWVNLRNAGLSWTLPLFVIAGCGLAFLLTWILPKSISSLGKIAKSN